MSKVSRKGKADKKKRKMAGMELPPNPQVRKSGKKGVRYQENQDGDGPSGKLPKVASPLTAFFGSFEKRRRLLVSCFKVMVYVVISRSSSSCGCRCLLR